MFLLRFSDNTLVSDNESTSLGGCSIAVMLPQALSTKKKQTQQTNQPTTKNYNGSLLQQRSSTLVNYIEPVHRLMC